MQMKNDTLPEQSWLYTGHEEDYLLLDKRMLGDQNRKDVLTWIARFGWLTSLMISALVWPEASQGRSMARRTLKALAEDKLIISRPLSKGGTAYLLAAKGARLLHEQTGLKATSGVSLKMGNPIHRACSNWYLIQALQFGFSIVTEHEIVTGAGPCRVLNGKQADGLLIDENGNCIWVECEHSQKAKAERHKTVALVQSGIDGVTRLEVAPGLWLSRVDIVGTNPQALRWMIASFKEAHRNGLLRDSQLGEVNMCLLPITPSLVPQERIDFNLYWEVIVGA